MNAGNVSGESRPRSTVHAYVSRSRTATACRTGRVDAKNRIDPSTKPAETSEMRLMIVIYVGEHRE